MTQQTISPTDTTRRPTGYQLAEYPTYEQAQRHVDSLSDNGFPVEHMRIIGTGIHSVEQVTGRLTTGRAALAGLGSGAWFGLLVGLLLGLFAPGAGWFGVILGGVLFGAFWGAVFAAVTQWSTRGRRDFSSVRAMVAERYSVEVDPEYAAGALRLSPAL